MSHIVRATIDLAYRDKELLIKALEAIGIVKENEGITIATGSSTYKMSRDKYDIVLESADGHKFRLGFRNENNMFVPFADEWGRLGEWVKRSLAQTKDNYLAYHYQKQLESEGFEVKVTRQNDGSLEVLATEGVW